MLPARPLESGGTSRNGGGPVPKVEELLDQFGSHATRHPAGGKHSGAGPAVQVLRRGSGACPLAPIPSGCSNHALPFRVSKAVDLNGRINLSAPSLRKFPAPSHVVKPGSLQRSVRAEGNAAHIARHRAFVQVCVRVMCSSEVHQIFNAWACGPSWQQRQFQSNESCRIGGNYAVQQQSRFCWHQQNSKQPARSKYLPPPHSTESCTSRVPHAALTQSQNVLQVADPVCDKPVMKWRVKPLQLNAGGGPDGDSYNQYLETFLNVRASKACKQRAHLSRPL